MRSNNHDHAPVRLDATQAARLLRDGHLGATLVARAIAMAGSTGDQAHSLRRLIQAHQGRPGERA